MPLPGPLDCPMCQDQLVYLLSVDGAHVYCCEIDGLLMISPDGSVRRTTSDDVRKLIDQRAALS